MLSQKVSGFEILRSPQGGWIVYVNRVWSETGTEAGTVSYAAKDIESALAIIRGLVDVVV